MTKLGVLKGHKRRPGTKTLLETTWEAFSSAVQRGSSRGMTEAEQRAYSRVWWLIATTSSAMPCHERRQLDRQKLLRHNTREERM